MKVFNNIYKYSLALLLALTSCMEQESGGSGESGYIELNVIRDASVSIVPVTKSSETVDMPVSLTIYDSKGAVYQIIEDFSSVTAPLVMPTGRYSVKATLGTESSVPVTDSPCYAGTAEFEVKANTVASVDVVCTLATTKVTAAVSQTIRDNFQYVLEITNGQGTEVLDQSASDEKEMYFSVSGTLSWTLTLTNSDDEQFVLQDSYSLVKAAQYYDLNFTLDTTDHDRLGAGEFSIIVDDSMNDPKIHDITIVIDKSAPVIEGHQSVTKSVSDEYNEGVYVIGSVLPITSAVVSHSDNALLQAGLPQNMDIVDDKYAVSKLSDAGVSVEIYAGATLKPSVDDETTEIRLDFSNLIDGLPVGQYTFTISSLNLTGKEAVMDVTINVTASINPPSLEPWAEFVYVKGSWSSINRPEGLKVQYRLSGTESWTDFVPSATAGEIFYDDDAKTFRAFVCGLTASSSYEVRVVSEREELAAESMNTGTAEQLYNMSFDEWSDGMNPYASGKSGVWDTANPGTAISVINIIPTTPESTDVISGKAVRMESMYKIKFAAGNIYTGEFYNVNMSKMGAELDWGVPFTSKPVGLKGWYKYSPVAIDRTGDGYSSLKGQMDKCQILISLFANWTSRFRIETYSNKFVDFSDANTDIVAYADILDESTNGQWVEFTLYAGYRKNTFRNTPTYIVTTACASYKGDYFTGGEGSVLLVDEFEYVYDPMKLSAEDRATFFGLFE